ncbi:MAG: S1C family serine protease [Hyphomicrobiaceae bacterium]
MIASNSKTLDGEYSQGSAVAVSSEYAITNCHVTDGMRFIAVYDTVSKKAYDAVVSNADVASDRCFLKVNGALRPISSVRAANSLAVGEQVFTIGNPSGLTNTLGEGIVSGIREQNVVLVQTTAQIAKGSSGGALIDVYGALIGITTFRIKDAEGLNFAIAADEYWK